MADVPAQPTGCRKAFGCLGVPATVLLVVLFVPPQLSRLTAGHLRPGQSNASYGRPNGWDELAALGARIRPAPADDFLAQNAALLTEIDTAMTRAYFVGPSLAWYAQDGDDSVGAVIAALDLSSLAATRDAAEGRSVEAVERWSAQLRAARAMLDLAQVTAVVDLGFDREMAVCQQVWDAMNHAPGPIVTEHWQPLRDALSRGPNTSRLVSAWCHARYSLLYAREFEPETLPAGDRPSGVAAWLDRLPPNCFDDPWHSLAAYRAAWRDVAQEAAKPRPERDLDRLRRSLEPQGLNIYNFRGRWVPAEALHGGDWAGFDGEDGLVAFRRLTDTMIALRIAYDRNQRLPASLQKLVTAGLLEEVPEDPFDAWPIKYDPERRLLWSVGADERDDSGKRTPGKWRPDIVVHLEFAE